MTSFVYLDYNATAPMKPAVRDTMLRLMDQAGNASSVHSFGRQARQAVEQARAHSRWRDNMQSMASRAR